ncbi:acylneuraminate cytidylyltransferase [Agromyces sp. H3Y2-19a]|uniref:acylneuraminate cytidylyltransferase n=1 Tax=Agromyces TaxID=33877 RepID=UPI001E353AD8|nr:MULTISPECIES: acylneuraminate cytidylyltransferase [Agromyces]MCD5346372.1 acylneuraminate cytidylyltransferase [Agromyces sp. S2-1-8]MDF0512736.1 acylneuraminate cytidylyltransferase [Agromyces chromiiresistens]
MAESKTDQRGVAVAIIPARGGSKGLPGKNLMRLGGVSLVGRAVAAAHAARSVGAVVVTTDDDEIARVARAAGATVVDRPADLSGDTASSESALLHALDELEARGPLPAVTLFVQATSPFIDPSDLDAAVARVVSHEADSVFAAVESHAFVWRAAGDGSVFGANHDAAVRHRRQEREPEFRETGAFTAMRTAGFRAARHRFFGRIAPQVVPQLHGVDIDTAADLVVARALVELIDRPARVVDVDAVVTDFDGVHTDDTAWIDTEGRELVRVSRSDGQGVARLRAAGVPVLVLSAETNRVVTARAAKLRVDVLQGMHDKAPALAEWAEARGIPLARIAYLGNDVGDLPAMALVGWPLAVADAVPAVRDAARLVLEAGGGDGAVRELAELVLAARDGATGAAPHERAATAAEPSAHRTAPQGALA